jgi:hypothetical protein
MDSRLRGNDVGDVNKYYTKMKYSLYHFSIGNYKLVNRFGLLSLLLSFLFLTYLSITAGTAVFSFLGGFGILKF